MEGKLMDSLYCTDHTRGQDMLHSHFQFMGKITTLGALQASSTRYSDLWFLSCSNPCFIRSYNSLELGGRAFQIDDAGGNGVLVYPLWSTCPGLPAFARPRFILRPSPLRAIFNVRQSIAVNEVDAFVLLGDTFNATRVYEGQDLLSRCFSRIRHEHATCAPALDISRHICGLVFFRADQRDNFAHHKPDKLPLVIALHHIFARYCSHLFSHFVIIVDGIDNYNDIR